MADRERFLFPPLQQLLGQSLRAKELSTCGNSAEVWPESLCALDLVSFITTDSGLSTVPHTLSLSTNLRILDMSGSALSEFPHGVEKLHLLLVLRLYRCCNIEILPNEITSLQWLRFLSLRECKRLRELPEHLRNSRGCCRYIRQSARN